MWSRFTVVVAFIVGILAGAASPAGAGPPAGVSPTCTPYQLHTAYGLLVPCTLSTVTSTASYSRAGYYSPHSGTYSWHTNSMPSAGAVLSCAFTANGRFFYGGKHMATAFGSASWGVEIDPAGPTGRFGWFNLHTRTFSADSGPLPYSSTGSPKECTYL
jgi:hypothetical protein